ncbi:hypothetical protein BH10ACT3_BH10ACT3_18400 [soil metagenome]
MAEPETIRRLIGVYDADSTLRGELSYWVGARLGRTHCSLCEITHGMVRERADWRSCRDGLSVPFDTYHRNDQPDDVPAATGDAAPVVAAQTDDRIVVLLDASRLEECDGSPERLVDALTAAAAEHQLGWP